MRVLTYSLNHYFLPQIGALAIGNPRLPQAVMEQWQWRPLPAAEHECKVISDLLSGQAITGTGATKDAVLQVMGNSEILIKIE